MELFVAVFCGGAVLAAEPAGSRDAGVYDFAIALADTVVGRQEVVPAEPALDLLDEVHLPPPSRAASIAASSDSPRMVSVHH